MDLNDPSPEEKIYTEEQLEGGRLLFAGDMNFVLSVANISQLPTDGQMEVAFAGRSNVGKSSIINAITGRNSFARTSNTPGRTRELNFFNIADQMHLVDMPGYGYAKASKTAINSWRRLIDNYLAGRLNLRRVFLLVDSRHGAKPGDLEMMDLLDKSAVGYQVILTKSDKIKPSERTIVHNKTINLLRKRPAAYPHIIMSSSKKAVGIEQIRAEMFELLQR